MGKQISVALHASLARVLTKIATLLPAMLALIFAVVVAALIGVALAWAVRKALASARFDERLRGSANWTTQRPSLILSRLVFWACFVLGLVVGVEAFASGYGNSELLAAFMLPYLAHIVGAVVLLIVGTLAARFLARTVLIGAVNMNLHHARMLSQGVKWLVLVLTAAMVLDHLNIGGRIVELAFGILFGGIVLTLSLSIGLGSRDIVIRTLEQEEPRIPPETATRITHF